MLNIDHKICTEQRPKAVDKKVVKIRKEQVQWHKDAQIVTFLVINERNI